MLTPLDFKWAILLMETLRERFIQIRDCKGQYNLGIIGIVGCCLNLDRLRIVILVAPASNSVYSWASLIIETFNPKTS
jgi:hypothetical protein